MLKTKEGGEFRDMNSYDGGGTLFAHWEKKPINGRNNYFFLLIATPFVTYMFRTEILTEIL